jgi:histidine triad (HIT) family protein
MSHCTFCDILANKKPSSIVSEDELCTAFMDIQPVNPGHVLVIPNQHAAHLADLDPDHGAHLFRIAQRIAQALHKSGLPCEGVNFFLADGEVAGQDVFHVHLHVIPRFAGDGFGLRLGPHYGNRPHRAELDMVAEAIRSAL